MMMTRCLRSFACVALSAMLCLWPFASARAESESVLKLPTLLVKNAQVRAAPPGIRSTTVYMSIYNESDQPVRLVDAASPASDDVELHKIMTNRGLKRMHGVEEIVIPAHGVTLLRKGSYHLMLVGLKKPLSAGDSVPIELRFADNSRVQLSVPVVSFETGKKRQNRKP